MRFSEPDALSSLPMSRLSLLVDLAAQLSRQVELDVLLSAVCSRIAEALNAERATVWLFDAERRDLVSRVALLPELDILRQPIDRGIAGHVARTGETVRVADASTDERFDPSSDRITGYTTRNVLATPIRQHVHAPVRGVVQLLNRRDGAFDLDDERYVQALAAQLAQVLALTSLRAANDSAPGLTLRGPFNHIIGQSAALREVYRRISLAAQTDASVLLRGETGTGKSLFARAIHDNSQRQSQPFIVVDCATLPTQLVESELFGHERGAFTGADRRVRGKVELAQGGTLFLDEIGDLPLEAQGKVLRFLQERVFERVGGRDTLHAELRVICATHQDLKRAVAEKRFREDLFFRIRVVEIEVPPLRQRGANEIEALTLHFAQKYAARYHRPVPHFGKPALETLQHYAWPGNVRELEHWVESAVVLSPDGTVSADALPGGRAALSVREARTSADASADSVGTIDTGPTCYLPLDLELDEASRRYAESVISSCSGNKTEAARRLKVGRNTLQRLLNRTAKPSGTGQAS